MIVVDLILYSFCKCMIMPVKPGSQGFFSAKAFTSAVIFFNIISVINCFLNILFGVSIYRDLPNNLCCILFIIGPLLTLFIIVLKYRCITTLKRAKQIMMKHNIDGTVYHLLIVSFLLLEIFLLTFLE